MDPRGKELAGCREAMRQAVANLQAQGIAPRPAVRALYEQYGRGELSRTQVQAALLPAIHPAGPARASK